MRFSHSYFGGVVLSLLLIGAGCVGSASKLAIGNNVYGEWTSQKWYSGTITETCDNGFTVAYDEGDQSCLAPDQIIHNKIPKKSQAKVGTKVIAKWTGTPYYDAEIVKIEGSTYTVKYYDGVQYDVTLEQLRLDPNPGKSTYKSKITDETKKDVVVKDVVVKEISTSAFAIGTPVEAIWKNDGKYWSGKIGKLNANGTYDIKWDDGSTQTQTKEANIRLKVGIAVEALWHSGSGYWSGKITKANTDGTYLITWDSDKTTQDKTKLSEIRIK